MTAAAASHVHMPGRVATMAARYHSRVGNENEEPVARCADALACASDALVSTPRPNQGAVSFVPA